MTPELQDLRTVLQITDTIAIADEEITERFVRATIRRLPASGKKFSDEVMTHIDRLRPRPRWPQYVGWGAAAPAGLARGAAAIRRPTAMPLGF